MTEPGAVDGRADLYALGATAYFLLTGSDVFVGRTVVDVLSQHLHANPEPLSSRLGQPVDPRIEALVLECLEKDPSKRPQTAGEVRERLKALLPHESWSEVNAAQWWQSWRLEHATRTQSIEAGASQRLTVGLGGRSSSHGTKRGPDAARASTSLGD